MVDKYNLSVSPEMFESPFIPSPENTIKDIEDFSLMLNMLIDVKKGKAGTLRQLTNVGVEESLLISKLYNSLAQQNLGSYADIIMQMVSMVDLGWKVDKLVEGKKNSEVFARANKFIYLQLMVLISYKIFH